MNISEFISPLSLAGIGTTLLCGVILGLERQLSGKTTGIRTSTLICLGAYIFVRVGTLVFQGSDPSRIVSQIITGIGFLGAGVILTKEGILIGVTSAAVIWVLAGVGILIGFHKFSTAIIISVIAVLVLVGVNAVEHWYKSFLNSIYKVIGSRRKARKGEF